MRPRARYRSTGCSSGGISGSDTSQDFGRSVFVPADSCELIAVSCLRSVFVFKDLWRLSCASRTSGDLFCVFFAFFAALRENQEISRKAREGRKGGREEERPRSVGEPRPKFAGVSHGVRFRPRVASASAIPLLRAGFWPGNTRPVLRRCNMPHEKPRPRIVHPRNVAASCHPIGSSAKRSRKFNGSSAVPSNRGLSVYIAPSPKRLVISVAQTLSMKANLLSSSNDGSLNSNGRRGQLVRGRFVYISPT